MPWRLVRAQPATNIRDLRASDADRERVVSLLSEAHADGRLTAAEHAERMTTAYTARTLGELTGLTADLLPAAAQPILVDDGPVRALFGSVRREGRWVVPVRLSLTALFGTAELDLREAILQRRHIIIETTAMCGRIRLLVPEGVRVDVTGRTMLSTRAVRVRAAGSDTGPVIELTGSIVFSSVRARTPRRNLTRRALDRMRGGRL